MMPRVTLRRERPHGLDDHRIERFDDERTVIIRQDFADALGQPQVAVELALDLDDERNALGDLAEETLQRRDLVALCRAADCDRW